MIICTTDHGIAFPYMKCNLNVHGTGVMLIIKESGLFSQQKVIDSLTSHIDISPTVYDFLGIPIPKWIEGTSSIPLINGKKQEIHEKIFGEVTFHAAYEPMRCVRTQRYVYIKKFIKEFLT